LKKGDTDTDGAKSDRADVNFVYSLS
jgi:hypothetical protein